MSPYLTLTLPNSSGPTFIHQLPSMVALSTPTLEPAEILTCDVDMEEVLRPALLAAERHAARLDSQLLEDAYAEDEWEDEDDIQSEPTSPPISTANAEPAAYPNVPGVERRRRADAARGRRSRRRRGAAPRTPYDRKPDTRYSQDHRELSPETVALNATDLPASSGGAWQGRSNTRPHKKGRGGGGAARRRVFTLPQLLSGGSRLVRWNGRDPKLIIDAKGRIVTILLGRPEDPDWDAVIADAVEEMARARRRCLRRGIYRSSRPAHRRGKHIPLTDGASLGGGQQRPGNLVSIPQLQPITAPCQKKPKRETIGRFPIKCVVWQPMHPNCTGYKAKALKGVFEHHPNLRHTFSNSIYPAVTFNCGP
ncbi:hypothetical protein DFH07DRAFT_953164 [Mycena maculata]|uniref:Uncharacterized protein n=1 Tax=Mycena maculata TaxID=230809 RepID=A0AAD7NS01_9AGAR|nr:hypothetical protein DFH07DRAFT_953164 [Mycena maculata]